MLGYAAFVTIIAVVFTVWIGYVSGKTKEKVDKVKVKVFQDKKE